MKCVRIIQELHQIDLYHTTNASQVKLQYPGDCLARENTAEKTYNYVSLRQTGSSIQRTFDTIKLNMYSIGEACSAQRSLVINTIAG